MRTVSSLFVLSFLALFAAAEEPAKLPIPAKLIKLDLANSQLGKVAPAITQRSGIPIAFPPDAAREPCDGIYNGKPFWEALEMLADQTGNRIVLREQGRQISLEPRGKSRELSTINGPFRVVTKQIIGRNLLELGLVVHDVDLLIHWEPRFPVFRIDAKPKISRAVDDRGVELMVQPSGGRTNLANTSVHETSIRLTGLTRDSRKIGVLAGEFTITAAEKMLLFRVDDLTAKFPLQLPAKERVEVVFKRFAKDEKIWEVELEVTNPPGGPIFESFESWAAENQLRLQSPDAAKSFTPDDYEIRSSSTKLIAIYRFKEDAARGLVNPAAKGWSMTYTTPAPMVEFKVPFELKDLPLP